MTQISDAHNPAFWRAGAISTTIVMLVVLVFLTIDSLQQGPASRPGLGLLRFLHNVNLLLLFVVV